MFKRYIQQVKDELKGHITKVLYQIKMEQLDTDLDEMLRNKEEDFAKMTEQHLKAADLNRTSLHKLDKKEQEELLKSAFNILKEPAFDFVIDQLIKAQIEETVTKGTSEEHYMMGRFSIAGMNRIREAVQAMAGQFEQLNKVDDFDAKSLI